MWDQAFSRSSHFFFFLHRLDHPHRCDSKWCGQHSASNERHGSATVGRRDDTSIQYWMLRAVNVDDGTR